MILQFGAMGMRSPFARVSVLLSSSTEFRFSIQMASTGPSIISQINSPVKNTQICHPQVNKLDVKLQCKQIYYDNLTGIFQHHFQSSISTLIQLFENCQLPYWCQRMSSQSFSMTFNIFTSKTKVLTPWNAQSFWLFENARSTLPVPRNVHFELDPKLFRCELLDSENAEMVNLWHYTWFTERSKAQVITACCISHPVV